MRWWTLTLIGLLVGPHVAAQTPPRCDAALNDFSKISADWDIKPNPPVRLGKDERQLLVRCGNCNPPVVVSVRTTDLSQPDPNGPPIDQSKAETIEATMADPIRKKAFADWYNSDIERLNPGCQVQTELRDTNTNSSGVTTATFYMGTWCRGQEREYSSGIEYIGGRGACAFRVTVFWSGKDPLPDASLDRVNQLFGHMKLLK